MNCLKTKKPSTGYLILLNNNPYCFNPLELIFFIKLTIDTLIKNRIPMAKKKIPNLRRANPEG
jgi:hypothetical protein